MANVPIQVPYNQPKSYLVMSILNTCCCCFILGLVAVIFSVKTREANKYGDQNAAIKYSKKAKKFNMLAFGIGACLVVCYMIYVTIMLVNNQGRFQPNNGY